MSLSKIFSILFGIVWILFKEGGLPILICTAAFFWGGIIGYALAAALVIAWWYRKALMQKIREFFS